jgi:hypothetical protein
MSAGGPSQRQWERIVDLSEEVLGLPEQYEESDVELRNRSLVADVHPDVAPINDDDARALFKAVQFATDVLTGETTIRDVINAEKRINNLQRVLDESQINNLREEAIDDAEEIDRDISEGVGDERRREAGGGADYSSVEDRKSPGDFDTSNFGAVTGKERNELIKEVSLGMRVMLRYQAVSPLMKDEVTQETFYAAINRYIDETGKGDLDNEDYYEASQGLLRQDIPKGIFMDSLQRLSGELSEAYVPDASVDEIADIIAMLVVDGKIQLGMTDFMAGQSNFRSPGSGRFRRDPRNRTYRDSYDNFRRP